MEYIWSYMMQKQWLDLPPMVNRGGMTLKIIFLSVSVTLDGAERTQAEINRTANHEAGHTASLYHPWGLKPDVADIKQGSPKVKDETLLNNVMNSGGNDEPKLRSTTGTKLTHGQRKKVSNTITKQHKKPLNVYNKNYHHCNCNGLLFCVKFFC